MTRKRAKRDRKGGAKKKMEERGAIEPPGLGHRLLETLPMYIMWMLGALIFLQMGWLFALTYLVYCVFSIVWFIRAICPYCANSRMNRCMSGLGQLSAILFEPRPPRFFRRQFLTNIGNQLPIWFLPPIAGGYLLYKEFSNGLLLLLVVFFVVAFGIVPLSSSKKACDDCLMRNVCPYHSKKKKEKKKKGGR